MIHSDIEKNSGPINQNVILQDILEDNFFKAMIDIAPVGIWVSDSKGNCVYANNDLLKITGLKREEMYATGWTSSIYPDDKEKVLSLWKKTTDAKMPFYMEYRFITPLGYITWTLARGIAHFDDFGQVVGYVGSIVDITKRHKVEEELMSARTTAEKANALKSQFLDMAAHELRTPVTAFSILVQLSQKQFLRGHPVELSTLKRMRSQSDRLAKLVSDLLEVSRLERGLSLNLELSDLIKIVSECIEDIKLRDPNKEIILSVAEESIPIELDPLRIFQVVSNILDNALKYTEKDTPIEVSILNFPTFVQVIILDHGPGITESQVESLFMPFTRGESEQVIRTSGMGLGLYICKLIVELHGGKIWVKSKMGLGSSFYFEIPKKKEL